MKSQQEYVLVFALMAACAGCSKKSEDAGATATTETAQEEASLVAATDAVPSATSQVKIQDLGKLVDVIVAEAAELPRAEFDPAALAAKLGKSLQAHFDWVRDHTWIRAITVTRKMQHWRTRSKRCAVRCWFHSWPPVVRWDHRE